MTERVSAATPLPGKPPRSRAKSAVFSVIRGLHRQFMLRDLPDNVAIYFHQLDKESWGSFSDAVRYFQDVGYRSVCPHAFLDAGDRQRRLFVSFDDNFADWHRALGLFDKLSVSATFYVNTLPFRDVCEPEEIRAYFSRISHDGRSPTLSREELRELADAGHVIGCHSHSHLRLSRLPRENWDREIAMSKRILEEIIGQPVTDFSYPYGMRRHFSEELRRYCVGQGFKTIATARPGLQHVEPRDPLSLHRTGWDFRRSLVANLENIQIDGRIFEAVTHRSPIG